MTAKAPPRVVLDTNVALSPLLFGSGPAARVRAGWQSRRFVPLASTATAQDLAVLWLDFDAPASMIRLELPPRPICRKARAGLSFPGGAFA